jgi:hypothetical protein
MSLPGPQAWAVFLPVFSRGRPAAALYQSYSRALAALIGRRVGASAAHVSVPAIVPALAAKGAFMLTF